MAEPKVEILSDSLIDGDVHRGWHRDEDGTVHTWEHQVSECLDSRLEEER